MNTQALRTKLTLGKGTAAAVALCVAALAVSPILAAAHEGGATGRGAGHSSHVSAHSGGVHGAVWHGGVFHGAPAAWHGGGYGGGWHGGGYGGGWHGGGGGHWVHGWHGGTYGWWWFGGGVWWPYYAWGYPYYPYGAYPGPNYYPPDPPSPSYGNLPPQQPQVWYYCDASGGYYPNVPSCPGGWRPVPATPAAPNGPPPGEAPH
jgi:hypothetical protein